MEIGKKLPFSSKDSNNVNLKSEFFILFKEVQNF
jgi:hypothetical protein